MSSSTASPALAQVREAGGRRLDASARPPDFEEVAGAHNRRWLELCELYLPVCEEGSVWRYSRAYEPGDPEQGWKLHVSATVLTACEVLQRVAPLMSARGVRFKAPRTLDELSRLNSGVFYGYSQVGKAITVYTRNDAEAVELARELDLLTRGVPAPSVPFDSRYGPESAVYYRYGAYTHLETQTADGARVLALRAPDGRLVPDVRAAAAVAPDWAADPFARHEQPCAPETRESPLRTFRAFRALSQRGKGGVYHAVDLSVLPPRLCVLKEGRRWGETNWDGRDGRWRVLNEERALRSLRSAGVEVPEVYASFEVEGNYYLAMEYVEGESLQQMLNRRRRRLSVRRALRLGAELARVISDVHRAGWAWRDCKPANIILTKRRGLVPLDFEGASPVSVYDPLRWLTPNFAPPQSGATERAGSNVPEDLYPLGAMVYFLLTGLLPSSPGAAPAGHLRRGVSREVSALISALLDANPLARPCAERAGQVLIEALQSG